MKIDLLAGAFIIAVFEKGDFRQVLTLKVSEATTFGGSAGLLKK